ncbi:MAG: 2OG-Fe(II) oxygenase [Candidatus Omnitrophica bacterium]|nr:2OG-Fe(II) oxygenase [Candidatus Omnitrophota bacterium]
MQGVDPLFFQDRKPYPWMEWEGFLLPGAFERLRTNFPALNLFEKQKGIDRLYGQRPHNRYYLAHRSKPSFVRKLPQAWRRFIEEIDTNPDYQDFIRSFLGTSRFQIRYAWHLGSAGSEVSPHFDSDNKLGTHIFYFNTPADWRKEWGGSICVLSGKKRGDLLNPDFTDFEECVEVGTLGNKSFFFKNSLSAWHGVRSLSCPPGNYRRLFNVIFVPVSDRDKLFRQPDGGTAGDDY